MDEWTENSQDINIFSDYDHDTESNDAEKIGKRKHDEINTKFSKKNAATDKKAKTIDQVNDGDAGKLDSLSKRVEESEISKTLEENSVWSIEDDTFFYPLGICNHCIAGANKSVIIIWSEYSVINFVIKKMINKKQTKTTRVRLSVHSDETIKDVQILEFNTLLLLESGRVNYFSSVKSMHSLPWLEGVRCIGRTLHGFCIIRLTQDQRLLLEVYEDTVDMGKKTAGSVKQQYDITFDDQNLFNCSWEDDNLIIFAIAIDAENLEFIQHLITHSCDLSEQNEVFIFAVSGNVFVLIPDASNSEMYHIETIFSYASNIGLIKIDHQRKFCLIFLECGTVDIWYMSTVTKKMLHQVHNTGAVYVNYTYSDSRASFFFTDESQVVELRFLYDPVSDKFSVKEIFKAIPGILACTWIETVEQLICLDYNNIFHQLSFETTDSDDVVDDNEHRSDSKVVPSTSVADYEKFNTLFELTPNRVTQLIEKSGVIRQLKKLPKDLYEAIEKEYLKQQQLAIDDKRNYYSKQLTAQLRLSKQLSSDFEANTVFLCTNTYNLSDENSLLAHISIQIACKDIFRNSIWQLHVHFDNSVHVFSLLHHLLESEIRLVIPLRRRTQQLIANIQLYLYNFLSHGNDHVALSLPIRLIDTTKTYVDLFAFASSHFEKMSTVYNLNDLLSRFQTPTTKTDKLEFHHFLSLPKNINFETIIKVFKVMPEDELKTVLDTCDIIFLNRIITMSWDKSKRILHVRSGDAGALYYFKLYLTLAYNEKQLPNELFQFDDCQQMILQQQCIVEHCHGDLADSDNNETNSISNQRLEALKQIYERMRKHLISK